MRGGRDTSGAFDTFDGAKPRFLNRGKKRRSVSTLSIPRASDRGVEWVDFFKGGGQTGGRGPEPLIKTENRTYDELIDEIMEWNIEHTDILSVLRNEVQGQRLAAWSDALETGIRRGLASASGKVEESPLYHAYLDLYQFVKGLRQKLLVNPSMKNARGTEKSDSLSLCIICGIRALQKERGVKRLMNTLQWMLLERYLG